MTYLFLIQVVAFSIFPIYFSILNGPLRRVSFYIYLSLVLLIGGFFGNIYSLPLAEGINISGGNICYGAFMMTSILFVLIEKDLFILRHLVRLVILVDIFNVIFSSVVVKSLSTKHVINPHNIDISLFDLSTPFIILGGVLIIIELLFLLFCFDIIKKQNWPISITAPLYIILFIAVLCSDGILFPLIAFGFSPEIITIVFGGIKGKIVMASSFSIPLIGFIIFRYSSFKRYLSDDSFHWKLLFLTSNALIKEMSEKDYGLQQARTIFKNSSEGLSIVDHSGHLIQANNAFNEMLKIHSKDIETNHIHITCLFQYKNAPLHSEIVLTEKWRGEVSFGEKNKHQGILSVTAVESSITDETTYVFSLVNIDEQKNIQQRLHYLARHDQLTLLPNRRILDELLVNSHSSLYSSVLLVIDLDHFKDINDSYGHASGDLVLKEIATRLSQVNTMSNHGKGHLVRTGGDEFALFIQESNADFAIQLVPHLQNSLKKPISLDNHIEVCISATIGISVQHSDEYCELLQEADAALYEAKRIRRGSFSLYEERLRTASQRKLTLSTKLKIALETHSLHVHYQPQYDSQKHNIVGVEALCRWNDAELGMISPAEFIPVAEESGLIEHLGYYVLSHACRDAKKWNHNKKNPIRLSVNISAQQLWFGQFYSSLQTILTQSNFPCELLELEVTESAYIEREQEVLPLLSKIKEMGIRLAIDDFGTGYSALSYLNKVPWDTLKIDRSFISQIPEDKSQCQLTSTIIELAQHMALEIVVEGVETQEQLDFVANRHCQFIQGFYFNPALPSDEIEKIL